MAYSPIAPLVAPLVAHEDLASVASSPRHENLDASLGYSRSGLCDSLTHETCCGADGFTLTDAAGPMNGWDLPPCAHNHFDNARVKKGMVELKCRDCGKKWRVQHPVATLCPEFHVTRGLCCLGSSCPYVHVHRYKSQERSPTHPHYVGGDRDDDLRRAAVAVLETKPFGTLPADVIGEIRAVAAGGKVGSVAAVSVPASRVRSPLSVQTDSTDSSPAAASLEYCAVCHNDSLRSSLLPTPSPRGSRLLPITSCYEPLQRTMYEATQQL